MLDRMLLEDWRRARDALASFLIIRAEHRYDLGQFEFVAFHEEFDQVDDHEQTPWYAIEFEAELVGAETRIARVNVRRLTAEETAKVQ